MADAGISVLSVAEKLLGDVDPLRSNSKEKHFHHHNGLFVNVEKNQWYSHGDKVGGDAIELVRYIKQCGFKDALEWLEEHPTKQSQLPQTTSRTKSDRTLVTTYNYFGPDGTARYHVNRYSDKTFSQWRMIDGEKVFGLTGGKYRKGAYGWVRANGDTTGEFRDFYDVDPLPYRLPELMQSDPKDMVLIPGGEKDVDNLYSLGLVATTNSGGEGKWTDNLGIWLKDRRVCILCDNDEMGETHQATVGGFLRDIAKEIHVLRFPTLPHKGDVSDWLEERQSQGLGWTKIRAELKRLCSEAPKWTPVSAPQTFRLTCLADVDPVAVDWLWPGYLAKGKLTLVGGDPGLGKSNITIDIAARLSCGRHMPLGPRPEPSATVFLLSEDSLADTVRPRLEAAEADLHKIHAFNSAILREGRLTRFTLGSDLDLLGQAVREVGASLVVIDAITSYMGKAENNSTTDIRSVMDPISDWAERHNTAVIGVTHPPKSAQSNAIRQFTGSFAYVASARVAFFISRDPDDNDRGLMLSVKNNIGELAPGRGFRVGTKEVSKGITAPCVIWDDTPVEYTADEVVHVSRSGTKLDSAMKFMRDYLADGPQLCTKCRADAAKKGISEITLRRAKEALGVVVVKKGGGVEAEQWQLPTATVVSLNAYRDDD